MERATNVVGRVYHLIRNRLFSGNPFFVVFHVTSRCNARCQFCFNWDNVSHWQQRDELSLEEIEKITQRMGSAYQLTIGGGEPFLRRDLPDIISLFHKNCGVQTVTIPTNGVLTRHVKESVRRIVEENPRLHLRLGISVPEIGEQLESIFQVKDSFRKQQMTYQELVTLRQQNANLTLSTGLCCNKYNSGRIMQILDFIDTNMPEAKAELTMVRGENPQCADALDIGNEEVEQAYAYHRKLYHEKDNRPMGQLLNALTQMINDMSLRIMREKKALLPCRSGEKLIVIYDNGDVFPCEILEDRKIGNLRNFDLNLPAILATPQAKETVEWIHETQCHCTWECANATNIIFSYPWMGRLLARSAKIVASNMLARIRGNSERSKAGYSKM